MTEWKARRFWKAAAAEQVDGGWQVALDGRPVRTPGKQPLVLPTEALARAVAAEWDAQGEVILPLTMPKTRAANSALEKVAPQFEAVAEGVAAYGDSDLLCYRAASPEELVARQAEAWDPMLDWAADSFGARLRPATGVMHVAQDPEALAALSAEVRRLTPFELTALSELVSLSGSLVLGLAALHDARDAGALWALSRVDETWQEEQWGADEEAQEVAALKRGDFLAAKEFFDLVRARA